MITHSLQWMRAIAECRKNEDSQKEKLFIGIIKDNQITIMSDEGDFIDCYKCEKIILAGNN